MITPLSFHTLFIHEQLQALEITHAPIKWLYAENWSGSRVFSYWNPEFGYIYVVAIAQGSLEEEQKDIAHELRHVAQLEWGLASFHVETQEIGWQGKINLMPSTGFYKYNSLPQEVDANMYQEYVCGNGAAPARPEGTWESLPGHTYPVFREITLSKLLISDHMATLLKTALECPYMDYPTWTE